VEARLSFQPSSCPIAATGLISTIACNGAGGDAGLATTAPLNDRKGRTAGRAAVPCQQLMQSCASWISG
jgi:hypothetical protein